MPTIVVMANPRGLKALGGIVRIFLGNFVPMLTSETLDNIAKISIKAVEREFGLQGRHDVAFTCLPVLFTREDADIQMEVRFSVGSEEYGGKGFNPNRVQQLALKDELLRILKLNLPRNISRSVWIIPLRDTVFDFVVEA